MVSISVFSYGQKPVSWGMGMDLSSNTYSNMHPRMTLDGKGNPMLVWGRMSDEAVLFSRWNGTMFTTPVKLNPLWLKVASASWMGPDIASKGDTVYVVVKRTPEASDTNHIYIMTSFNGGISFSSPVLVDFIADSVSRFPTVTVDATGNPIVAFMKFNSSFLKSRWVVTRSTDYGKTFSADVRASGYSGVNAEVCDCCPGALVTSGSVSAMLYRDNLSNIRDIWTGISTNNNASFKNGFAADNTKWNINSCPSSGPDGVIAGDSLYSVFLSGGSGNYRTYLSKSSIISGGVNSVKSLTGNIAGLSQQNYPRIANDGNAMAIVWKQTVSGGSQLPILFTNNLLKGFPPQYDTVDLKDITNADVAMSQGNIFVVWQDDNSGTVKYRKGTYQPFVSKIDKILQSDFLVFPNPGNETLSIQFNDEIQSAEIRVMNTLGEIQFQNLLTFTANKTMLDISSLTNGIYIIQLQVNERVITRKFIKQ